MCDPPEVRHRLAIVSLVAPCLTSGCRDKPVEALGVGAFRATPEEWRTIDVNVPGRTYDVLANRGDVYLFVTDCGASATPVQVAGIDSPTKQQPPVGSRPGVLRFVISTDATGQAWKPRKGC